MASNSKTPTLRKILQRLKRVINSLEIVAALSILIGFILYFELGSFLVSPVTGLRSLAAAALPFIIISFIGFFTLLLRTSRHIPAFSLYFVFSLWSLLLLGLASEFYGRSFHPGELLFSFTLAATIWRYDQYAFKSFVSCCYGIVPAQLDNC